MTTTYNRLASRDRSGDEKEPETKGGDRGASPELLYHRDKQLSDLSPKKHILLFPPDEGQTGQKCCIKYFSEKPNNKLELLLTAGLQTAAHNRQKKKIQPPSAHHDV